MLYLCGMEKKVRRESTTINCNIQDSTGHIFYQSTTDVAETTQKEILKKVATIVDIDKMMEIMDCHLSFDFTVFTKSCISKKAYELINVTDSKSFYLNTDTSTSQKRNHLNKILKSFHKELNIPFKEDYFEVVTKSFINTSIENIDEIDSSIVTDFEDSYDSNEETRKLKLMDKLVENQQRDLFVKNLRHFKKFDGYYPILNSNEKPWEIPTDTGRIDVLLHNKEKKTYLVLEFKRDISDDIVIGQISRYIGDIIKERETEKNREMVYGIIMSPNRSTNLERALIPHKGLIEYLKFEIKMDMEITFEKNFSII